MKERAIRITMPKTCSARCPLSHIDPEYHASDYYISCPFRASREWYRGMRPTKECIKKETS